MTKYICPVCGFDGLVEAPYSNGEASFEICPSCGTEFGLDDSDKSTQQLREDWIASGMRWWSDQQSPPPHWDPAEQLKRVDLASM